MVRRGLFLLDAATSNRACPIVGMPPSRTSRNGSSKDLRPDDRSPHITCVPEPRGSAGPGFPNFSCSLHRGDFGGLLHPLLELRLSHLRPDRQRRPCGHFTLSCLFQGLREGIFRGRLLDTRKTRRVLTLGGGHTHLTPLLQPLEKGRNSPNEQQDQEPN